MPPMASRHATCFSLACDKPGWTTANFSQHSVNTNKCPCLFCDRRSNKSIKFRLPVAPLFRVLPTAVCVRRARSILHAGCRLLDHSKSWSEATRKRSKQKEACRPAVCTVSLRCGTVSPEPTHHRSVVCPLAIKQPLACCPAKSTLLSCPKHCSCCHPSLPPLAAP